MNRSSSLRHNKRVDYLLALDQAAADGDLKEVTAGNAGIAVVTTDGVAAVSNEGILSVAAGAGIGAATVAGVATVSNTGVLSVTAGTNVTIGGTAANPVINASEAASFPSSSDPTAAIAGGGADQALPSGEDGIVPATYFVVTFESVTYYIPAWVASGP